MAGGAGKKKRFQYCTDPSGQEILYLRALQGHPGRNPSDPTLEDNVMNPNNFFDAGEERVTAKSKPTINLVSRYSVRDPNVLASTASGSTGETKSESQNVPLSSLNVQQTSTGRPVLGASSSNYSEWNIDDKWSSQVWKSGEMLGTNTGKTR